jgi:hypothetical protein
MLYIPQQVDPEEKESLLLRRLAVLEQIIEVLLEVQLRQAVLTAAAVVVVRMHLLTVVMALPE